MKINFVVFIDKMVLRSIGFVYKLYESLSLFEISKSYERLKDFVRGFIWLYLKVVGNKI